MWRSPSPHTRPIQHDGVIEEGAVAVRRVSHLLDQTGKQCHVMDIDPCVLRDVVGVELVVRYGMVPFRNPHPGICSPAQLAGQLEATHPCDVGLICQQQQVEQEGHMLFILLRDTRWLVDGRQRPGCVALFGALNTTLDFANRVEIVRHHHTVGNPQTTLDTRECSR